MYSAIAWAAAKCRPIFRRRSPFSCRAIVASSPSWWKSRDLQPAAGADPGPGVEEELQDRPVPVVQHRVAGRQPHELPGPGRREGPPLVARVGGAAGDELGMRRVRDGDGQPQLRGGALEVLVEAGERGDPAVDRLGRLVLGDHQIPEGQHVGHGHGEQPGRVVGPAQPQVLAEGHDVPAVGPLGMLRRPAGDPALEDVGDGVVETLDLGGDLRRRPAEQDGRQLGPAVLEDYHQLRPRRRPSLSSMTPPVFNEKVPPPALYRHRRLAEDNRFYLRTTHRRIRGRGPRFPGGRGSWTSRPRRAIKPDHTPARIEG